MEINSENTEKDLLEKLEKLPNEKWKIWRLIAVGIFIPFIGPYFPMRKGMLADRMGFENAALLFGGLCIVVIPIACYMHIQKINTQIFDAELELKSLRWKNKQKIENGITE